MVRYPEASSGTHSSICPQRCYNALDCSPPSATHTTLVKMSSHVVVVAPDVKRVSVKVNPGTYMFDVLDEACKKLNLQVDKWSLK